MDLFSPIERIRTLLKEIKEIRKQNGLCGWHFYYFYFERNYDVLKSKSPCFLLSKNKN